MSNRLPYEEQLARQLNDLPLPDENMAWEDMKCRLKEDDDDRIIPFWLRGCGLWGLLFLTLTGFGWWLIWKNKDDKKKQPSPVIMQKDADGEKKLNTGNKNDSIILTGKEFSNESPSIRKDKKNDGDTIRSNLSFQTNDITSEKDIKKISAYKKRMSSKKDTNEPFSAGIVKPKNKITAKKQVTNKDNVSTYTPHAKTKSYDRPAQERNERDTIANDTLNPKPQRANNIDSLSMKDSVNTKMEDRKEETNDLRKDSSKSKSISFSAGLAIHQLLPVNGQKLNPYNSQGRKSSLADYIPAIYLRMYKTNKWFLQSEFRYGAPQYNRELVYQRQNRLDTFGITNTITFAKLRKTFYHQLPVSFNYFILPDWSVGGGFVWNKFKGAVSEQDIVQRNLSTGSDSVLSKGVILTRKNADSNFVKSYFQVLVETQYRWKRFSLGARYSVGLQPYLKFKLPGQAEQKERNSSLQVFIRYELWKSKAKSLKEKRR